MKAFIGLLHLFGDVALTVLAVPELWLLPALLYKELEERCDDAADAQFLLLHSDLSASGLFDPPQDREARRWRAMLLSTYTAEESIGVKS